MKHGDYKVGTALGVSNESWNDKRTGELKTKTVFGIKETAPDAKGNLCDTNYYFNVDSRFPADQVNALRNLTDKEIMLPVIYREIKTGGGNFKIQEVDPARPVLVTAQLKAAAAA